MRRSLTGSTFGRSRFFDLRERGLRNETGEQNCFLNVVIQALWHLHVFRKRFLDLEHHSHSDPCIFCALKVIFTQFEYSDADVLPPTALRDALSAVYASQRRFQLGELDDAAESLEAVLLCLHVALAEPPGPPAAAAAAAPPLLSGGCGEPPCLAHDVFEVQLVEQSECPLCRATSEPLLTDSIVNYFLIGELQQVASAYRRPVLDRLLRAVADSERRQCVTPACKAQCPVRRHLLRLPPVFCLGLAWESGEPSKDEIARVTNLIDQQINLAVLFHVPETAGDASYQLRGMICYYGHHYDAFFFNSEKRAWWVFDDATAKEVGRDWSDVLDRCRRGHLQPAVLFYERIAALEEAESAPAASPSILEVPSQQPRPPLPPRPVPLASVAHESAGSSVESAGAAAARPPDGGPKPNPDEWEQLLCTKSPPMPPVRDAPRPAATTTMRPRPQRSPSAERLEELLFGFTPAFLASDSDSDLPTVRPDGRASDDRPQRIPIASPRTSRHPPLVPLAHAVSGSGGGGALVGGVTRQSGPPISSGQPGSRSQGPPAQQEPPAGAARRAASATPSAAGPAWKPADHIAPSVRFSASSAPVPSADAGPKRIPIMSPGDAHSVRPEEHTPPRPAAPGLVPNSTFMNSPMFGHLMGYPPDARLFAGSSGAVRPPTLDPRPVASRGRGGAAELDPPASVSAYGWRAL